MPREVKPEGLPGERMDLSDIFSALPGTQVTGESPTKEMIGDQFRGLVKWIESVGGKHKEIPVRCPVEYTGPVVKVDDYFSVQSVGRGEYVTHINDRLDCTLTEGCIATIRIDAWGQGRVAVQPQQGVSKGGRAD